LDEIVSVNPKKNIIYFFNDNNEYCINDITIFTQTTTVITHHYPYKRKDDYSEWTVLDCGYLIIRTETKYYVKFNNTLINNSFFNLFLPDITTSINEVKDGDKKVQHFKEKKISKTEMTLKTMETNVYREKLQRGIIELSKISNTPKYKDFINYKVI